MFADFTPMLNFPIYAKLLRVFCLNVFQKASKLRCDECSTVIETKRIHLICPSSMDKDIFNAKTVFQRWSLF